MFASFLPLLLGLPIHVQSQRHSRTASTQGPDIQKMTRLSWGICPSCGVALHAFNAMRPGGSVGISFPMNDGSLGVCSVSNSPWKGRILLINPFHIDTDPEDPVYHDQSECPYGQEKSNETAITNRGPPVGAVAIGARGIVNYFVSTSKAIQLGLLQVQKTFDIPGPS